MDDKRILDAVRSPADLKLLSDEELALLACEIREEIVTVTSQTGGHVASSLGAVEIILAAHSLLDCPTDKLVFDVGHQAYAHKLVTGRLDLFDTLRTYGGVSGFPKPDESSYDVHPSGHASDSLSVALGLAKARDLRGGTEKVVAVIGDAALSGGMAFEALNHIGQAQTPLVIILNDNEMSISRNVGALMKHLGYMRASTQYRQTRDSLQEKLESSGPFGTALANFGRNMKESMKQFVIPRSMIFEQLGILCTAPIDGHDIGALRETLSTVLATDGPVLMHVVTKKGAGYEPASRNPERFHGVGPYDIATGELVKKEAAAPSYTDVFGQAIVREARQNPDIVAITAAMKDGTGLAPFAEEFPDRFVDAGIAEEHAVGMAAGQRRAHVCRGGHGRRLGGGRQEAGRGHLLDVSSARHRPDDHQLRLAGARRGLRHRPRRDRGRGRPHTSRHVRSGLHAHGAAFAGAGSFERGRTGGCAAHGAGSGRPVRHPVSARDGGRRAGAGRAAAVRAGPGERGA